MGQFCFELTGSHVFFNSFNKHPSRDCWALGSEDMCFPHIHGAGCLDGKTKTEPGNKPVCNYQWRDVIRGERRKLERMSGKLRLKGGEGVNPVETGAANKLGGWKRPWGVGWGVASDQRPVTRTVAPVKGERSGSVGTRKVWSRTGIFFSAVRNRHRALRRE